jgi:lysophospholipase L1-like esterase
MQWASCFSVGLLVGTSLAAVGCGSSSTDHSGQPAGSGSGGGSGEISAIGGSGGSGGSGSAGNSGSGSSSGSSSGAGSGGTAGAGADGGSGSGSSSGGTSGSSSGSSSGGNDAGAPCVKGQVKPNEVIMLGDSYMDIGHVGPTIQKDANATYRTYYQAGAALNYGTLQGNIPYQYESLAIPASSDIKVVIMDGGGNDVLINNAQCLSTPVMGDTACHMAIDGSVARGKKLVAEMVTNGVQHVVFLFYPHVSPTVGADANDWLDYAYPQVAQLCCGANAPAQGSSDYTCYGTMSATDCVFIDTRPEFVGHNMAGSSNYWFQDGIHPTQPGADVIAAKVWAQMQKYCIAQ